MTRSATQLLPLLEEALMGVETHANATSERKEKPLRQGAAVVSEPLREEAQMAVESGVRPTSATMVLEQKEELTNVDSERRDKPLRSCDESETNTLRILRPRRLEVPPQSGRTDNAT